jgi:hypothetical protein
VNEELVPKSSLDLTLMQHLHDEDFEQRKMCARFEVDSLRAWYYCISLNFCTLVILLQIDLISSDELEIVCEGCYEIEDTSIFVWSSNLGVGHYCWLHRPIC